MENISRQDADTVKEPTQPKAKVDSCWPNIGFITVTRPLTRRLIRLEVWMQHRSPHTWCQIIPTRERYALGRFGAREEVINENLQASSFYGIIYICINPDVTCINQFIVPRLTIN